MRRLSLGVGGLNRAHSRAQRRARLTAVVLCVWASSACEREERAFRTPAGLGGRAAVVRVSELRPGPRSPDPTVTVYEENRWAVSEGMRLFGWFNCADCHGQGGGGGMGPPLRDDEWIYGSEPENIYATIMQGRPNGMPAFTGRIDAADTWKLVAFVRSMARLGPRDTWSARSDRMTQTNPWRIE